MTVMCPQHMELMTAINTRDGNPYHHNGLRLKTEKLKTENRDLKMCSTMC